ncbi:MAG: TIGR01212 family radical SAM protein [Lachnospiraceae bacterium]|nr:TIGR01212 family radical SAM protein [Lachnospiraceae bacterium]
MEYLSFSEAMKAEFGGKVYKLSLSSGCTCPNRDGTIGTGGCTFCSEGGSGDFAAPFLPIEEQVAIAKEKVDRKFPKKANKMYMAYFQSYTNTYGDPERLGALFRAAIAPDDIVALSVGTRPDCIPDGMLGILKELNAKKPVFVELGLQTIHERTAEHIHRGYTLPVFCDTYMRLKEAGLRVVVHVILGLPGETEEDMVATCSYLAELPYPPDGVKLQLLHVLKGTQLAEEYASNPFPVFTLDDYCKVVVRCLKVLPKETVIHRLTGDGPKKLLIAPLWSADKKHVMNTLQNYIREA